MILYDIETKTIVRSDQMVFHLKAFGETEQDAIKIAENNIVESLRSFYQVKSNLAWDSIDRFLDESIVFTHSVTISKGL